MTNASQIKERMQVIGSDGQHVGTVDKVEGNNIKLTRSDPASGGQHQFISMDLVGSVEQDTVRLNMPADQARQQGQRGGSMGQGQTAGSQTGQGGGSTGRGSSR
ncbi:MAG: DUF2171 domain-containing protein [Blastocatellia bacterium]